MLNIGFGLLDRPTPSPRPNALPGPGVALCCNTAIDCARAAPKTTRAGAIAPYGRQRFIPAKSEKPQAVRSNGQKAAAWGRVGFGAAALRALIPRPRINHRSGQRIGYDISKPHAPNLPAMR